jgi:formate dehydrogenase major subunit
MSVRTFIEGWPVYRQLKGTDPLGRGAAVKSGRSARLDPRTRSADNVVKSVCPYCAVGCGQNVYVKD